MLRFKLHCTFPALRAAQQRTRNGGAAERAGEKLLGLRPHVSDPRLRGRCSQAGAPTAAVSDFAAAAMAKSAKLQAVSAFDVTGEHVPLLSSASTAVLSDPSVDYQLQDTSTRRWYYNMLTHRHSSPAAHFLAIFTFVLVCITIAFYVVRSLPQYWHTSPGWLWLPEYACFGLLLVFQCARLALARDRVACLTDVHTVLTIIALVPFALDVVFTHTLNGQALHLLAFIRFVEVFRVLLVRTILPKRHTASMCAFCVSICMHIGSAADSLFV